MTIQISVVIWTIICFAALYLILKYLLFKPVLEIIDKREAKIEAAKKAEEESEKRFEENTIARQKEIDAMLSDAQQKAKAEIEKVRLEGKSQLEEVKKERIRIVEEHSRITAAEYDEDIKKADSLVNEKVGTFLDRLFVD